MGSFCAQIFPKSMWVIFKSLAHLCTKLKSLRLSAAPHSGWCFADGASRDVLPQGHAFGASAPELMSASAKVKAGLQDDTCRINGCAADMWSVGTVLYEILTGHRAFNPAVPEDNIPPAQGRHEWAGTVLKQTNALVGLASYFSCSCPVKLNASFAHACFCKFTVVAHKAFCTALNVGTTQTLCCLLCCTRKLSALLQVWHHKACLAMILQHLKAICIGTTQPCSKDLCALSMLHHGWPAICPISLGFFSYKLIHFVTLLEIMFSTCAPCSHCSVATFQMPRAMQTWSNITCSRQLQTAARALSLQWTSSDTSSKTRPQSA